MSDEFDRGINNRLVTEDLIRHYSDAIGDPNPLFRNPDYGKASRWGSVIGPPTFETTIAYGTSFGGGFKLPGCRGLVAGTKHVTSESFAPGMKSDVTTSFLVIMNTPSQTSRTASLWEEPLSNLHQSEG